MATITHPWHYRQPWIVDGLHVFFAWVNEAQTSKCFLSKENEGQRVLTASAVTSTPSHGAPSPPPHQLSGLQGRQTSSSTLRKLPWDWFTPSWQMLVQTGISHTASCCPFPGGFQPAFPCLFYYWVRGQLRRVGSLHPASCAFLGLYPGHQAQCQAPLSKAILLAPAFLILKNRLEVKGTYLLASLMTSIKSVKQ